MRILQIVHQLPLRGGAGAENYTMQIAEELSNRHDVTVLTAGERFFDGPQARIQQRTGYPFPVYAYFRHPANLNSPEKEYWRPDYDQAFLDLLDRLKPDAVHFQHCINLSISLVTGAVRAGFPVYFTLHDYWTLCPNIVLLDETNRPCQSVQKTEACRGCMSLKFRAPRIWMAGQGFYQTRRERMIHALNECTKILAPSITLANRMIEAGISPTRIRYWPFGLDTRSIHEKKNLQKPLSYPLRFGYTGTISPQKGIETMLKCFQILPADRVEKVRLFVYGSFDRTPAIHRRVIRWMKRCAHRPVTFAGYYSQQQLPEILDNLDVVICPSIWYENRPLSIIESFAAGIPVIASRLGGMRELVEDTGAGWTFPPGDHKALALIIESLIENPDLILERRANIPEIQSIEDEVHKLEQLYLAAELSPAG